MSFNIYGPIATFTKVVNYNEVALHLAGDKILLYLQGEANPWSLYDLRFNHLRTLHTARDFCRVFNLTVHRLEKNPEIYTGYGSYSPRCTGFNCSSEFERYTYGSDVTDLICPNENCYQGNTGIMYHDVRTGKILAGSFGAGGILYILDPDTKEVRKWKVRGISNNSHFETEPIVVDDNTIYVCIGKPNSWPLSEWVIRKYTVSEFYNVFGSGNIEDYGEEIYRATNTYLVLDRGTVTYAPFHKRIALTNYQNNYYQDTLNLDTLQVMTNGIGRRYIGKYGLRTTAGATSLEIFDIESHRVVQTITLPYPVAPSSNVLQVDTPFLALYDATRIYIYLITYNGVAPVIQYDHANHRLRVVDYITGNVLNAELWVWRSRFCYPLGIYPVNIQPETLVVNDWTPVPSALKTECLTFAIKDVQTGR